MGTQQAALPAISLQWHSFRWFLYPQIDLGQPQKFRIREDKTGFHLSLEPFLHLSKQTKLQGPTDSKSQACYNKGARDMSWGRIGRSWSLAQKESVHSWNSALEGPGIVELTCVLRLWCPKSDDMIVVVLGTYSGVRTAIRGIKMVTRIIAFLNLSPIITPTTLVATP